MLEQKLDGEPCQTCGHGYAIHEFYNEMACEHWDWNTLTKCLCERFAPSPELAAEWQALADFQIQATGRLFL